MAWAERIAGLDALFLHLEGPCTPYHNAGLLICDGPAPSDETIRDSLGGRLPYAPRLLQRLVPSPPGRPVLVDDPHFDLDDHLRRTTVSSPGTPEQLMRLIGRLHAQPLPRSKPLWECWIIDGLAGDRFALMLKMHHSIFDGVSGAALARVLLDPSPEGSSLEPESWSPRPMPGRLRLAGRVVADAALAPARTAGAAIRAMVSAGSPGAAAGAVVAAAGTLGGAVASVVRSAMHPAPRCAINLPIGPKRIVGAAELPLGDFKLVKDRLGGTVNDVVLSVVAGGLRTWLEEHDADVRAPSLQTLVPVSLRSSSDAASGNLVTGIRVPLPVGEADGVRRLAILRRATGNAKRSSEAAGTSLLLSAGGVLPAFLIRPLLGFQSAQRLFNLCLTNVPGPPQQLWFLGRPVRQIVPLTPLAGNMGLIVAVMSYAGAMTFGLVADPVIVPDLDVIVGGIEKSLMELVYEAEAR